MELTEGVPGNGLPEPSGKPPENGLEKGSGIDLGKPLPSSEVKVEDKVKDKEEGEVENEEDHPPAAVVGNSFTVYEQNIGPLTPAVAERIKLAEQDYSIAWVVEAIGLAARRNKRRWDYVEGILRNWHRDGKDDGEKPEKTYADELAEAGYTLPQEVPAEWLA